MQLTVTDVMDGLGEIFSYWYLRPEEGSFDEAWREFCRVFNLADFFDGQPEPDALMWAEEEFEEWYLFSFQLPCGRTPLQRYLDLQSIHVWLTGGRASDNAADGQSVEACVDKRAQATEGQLLENSFNNEEDPTGEAGGLDRRVLDELRALLRSEHFGVFAIEQSNQGTDAVTLRDLYTDMRYPVDIAELGGEVQAQTVALRLADICGGWHVVGAFMQFLPDRYVQAMARPMCRDHSDQPVEHLSRPIGFVEIGRLMALSMSRYVREAKPWSEGEAASGSDVPSEFHQVLEYMREEELVDTYA